VAVDAYTVKRAMSKAPKPDDGEADKEEPAGVAAAKSAYKELAAAIKSGNDDEGFAALKDVIHYCTK
jgi:hypothetical protein